MITYKALLQLDYCLKYLKPCKCIKILVLYIEDPILLGGVANEKGAFGLLYNLHMQIQVNTNTTYIANTKHRR